MGASADVSCYCLPAQLNRELCSGCIGVCSMRGEWCCGGSLELVGQDYCIFVSRETQNIICTLLWKNFVKVLLTFESVRCYTAKSTCPCRICDISLKCSPRPLLFLPKQKFPLVYRFALCRFQQKTFLLDLARISASYCKVWIHGLKIFQSWFSVGICGIGLHRIQFLYMNMNNKSRLLYIGGIISEFSVITVRSWELCSISNRIFQTKKPKDDGVANLLELFIWMRPFSLLTKKVTQCYPQLIRILYASYCLRFVAPYQLSNCA